MTSVVRGFRRLLTGSRLTRQEQLDLQMLRLRRDRNVRTHEVCGAGETVSVIKAHYRAATWRFASHSESHAREVRRTVQVRWFEGAGGQALPASVFERAPV